MAAILQFAKDFDTPEKAVVYLRQNRILRQNPPTCTRVDCNRQMTEVRDGTRADGLVWRCPSHKGIKKSVRTGSFFEQSKLSLDQLILLIYTWCMGISNRAQQDFIGVGEDTVTQCNQYFRDICSRWIIMHPPRLGGDGLIVEIDESLIAKRKYNRGRMIPEKWVFGLYDVQTKIGVLEYVPDRTRETLLPIIEKNVIPGSIIHSDGWAAYGGGAIAALPVVPPFTHVVVNHSENFVDPISGACTNHVESFWKRAKSKNKAMNGTSAEMMPSYLDEFMWRQQYGKTTSEAYHNMLIQISALYPTD